ncbi:cation diffusion facilitator family transporter [Halorarum halophilum]|uniref:Cation diffusion facilitator family transporter n=1 Tax=Halorarum halophilum TaxID=2743090 RepID=A0A7D5K8V2_9EURY|nr:cation diffusion facilitator family transporter [Halobaculum halophilum]QLG28494.1 cation diffusion facilitator family transporter [Halobaculum halophilum]
MAGSKSVVIAALIANGAIAVMKFVGYLLTGSPSMLSETYHSISDTGNQVFLLFGIRYSGQKASRAHPYGYGKAQFFYAFLVSVLLFGIAGWESLKHGWNALTHGGHGAEQADVIIGGVNLTNLLPVEAFWVNVVVLLGAIAFETYAFAMAYAELRRQTDLYGWSGFREAFRKTSDVTTLTAFTEDAVALGGAVIALVGITATRITGVEAYDAASAVVIGVLLMGFAVALALENKRLLLGESLPADVESGLRGEISGHDGVTGVDGFRTMFIGPGEALVTADVSFDPDLVTGDIEEDIHQIESKLRKRDNRVRIVYIEPEV